MRNAGPGILLLVVVILCGVPFAGVHALLFASPERPSKPDKLATQDADLSAPASELVAKTFKPSQLLADFRIARQALEEGHSGIYRYTSKAELDRIFDRAEQSLTRPMNVLEFYRVLTPVLAAVKCGHTDVSLPKDSWKTFIAQVGVLPLQVRVLDDKLYVYRDLSSMPTSLVGKEIRAINGIAASRIVEKMLAAASGDGDIQTVRLKRISDWPFSIKLSTLLGLFGPYEVAYWEPDEKRELKVSLPGAVLAELQETARVRFPQDLNAGKAAELQFLDAGAVAVIKIRGFSEFVDAKRTQKLADFFQESFDAMHKRGTKALILDLRNNGGGEDELGKRLLSYLLDKPFKYYDELVINARKFGFHQDAELPEVPANAVERTPNGKYRALTHPNLGIQQPRKPTFAGKVFILMNGHSFSTTAEFLSLAHHHHRAKFIGEEAGGAYHGNTSGVVAALTLPNTKLVVHVPLVSYYLAVDGSKPAAHGVLPDHSVRYHVKELLEGTDKELTLALKLARKPIGGSK
jgi:hypothetical protein